MKQDKNLCSIYQYGNIHSLKISEDGKIRRAVIKYRNHNESTDWYTNRAVREIVMIHPIDELDIITELCDLHKNVESEKNDRFSLMLGGSVMLPDDYDSSFNF